jgi:hypothetical protein
MLLVYVSYLNLMVQLKKSRIVDLHSSSKSTFHVSWLTFCFCVNNDNHSNWRFIRRGIVSIFSYRNVIIRFSISSLRKTELYQPSRSRGIYHYGTSHLVVIDDNHLDGGTSNNNIIFIIIILPSQPTP